MSHDTVSFIALCIGLLVFLLVVSFVSKNYSLNRIKSKTVGDGQHGTARWATLKEIGKTYAHIPFDVAHWRKGERLPQKQGVVVGSMGGGKKEQRRIAALGRTAVRYVKRDMEEKKVRSRSGWAGVDPRAGGQRRYPLLDDRCLRRGQDRVLFVPEFGVHLRQRNELPRPRQQG